MAYGSGLVSGGKTTRVAGQIITDADHQRAKIVGIDVPEERPGLPLELGEVGIGGKTVWVRLPQGLIPFFCEIVVNLPASLRGIHMSRIEEVIADLYDHDFVDLRAYGLGLAKGVIARQRGSRVKVALAGKLPVLHPTLISGKTSVDSVEIFAEVTARKGKDGVFTRTMVGARVCHITMCPCTQAYNQAAFPHVQSLLGMPTHSQRSMTRLLIGDYNGRPTYEELLRCLSSAIHVTQDLMKRPDEAELVLKAQISPQFAEDAVRETARMTGLMFGPSFPASTPVLINSLSLESIHIHDVRCGLRTTLGAIMITLKKVE